MIVSVTNVKSELTEDLIGAIRSDYGATGRVFDADCCVDMWGKLIAHNLGAIWLIKEKDVVTGATGAIAHVEPMEGIMVVAQSFLFLRKGYRSHLDAAILLLQVETFAWARKASRVVTAVCYDTMDGKQAQFMERCDYRPYETRYFKNLSSSSSWEPKQQ